MKIGENWKDSFSGGYLSFRGTVTILRFRYSETLMISFAALQVLHDLALLHERMDILGSRMCLWANCLSCAEKSSKMLKPPSSSRTILLESLKNSKNSQKLSWTSIFEKSRENPGPTKSQLVTLGRIFPRVENRSDFPGWVTVLFSLPAPRPLQFDLFFGIATSQRRHVAFNFIWKPGSTRIFRIFPYFPCVFPTCSSVYWTWQNAGLRIQKLRKRKIEKKGRHGDTKSVEKTPQWRKKSLSASPPMRWSVGSFKIARTAPGKCLAAWLPPATWIHIALSRHSAQQRVG